MASNPQHAPLTPDLPGFTRPDRAAEPCLVAVPAVSWAPA